MDTNAWSREENIKKFELLVEQAGDAFFILDFTGRILDVNRQTTISLGYSREELLRKTISEIDIEVDEKDHRFRHWEKLPPGQYTTFEGTHKRKDGGTFPVEIRLGRLDVGEERYLLALCRDITDRKKAEQALKNSLAEIKVLKERLEAENLVLREDVKLLHGHAEIIGNSSKIMKVLKAAEQVAKTDANVLILGETGTGKELLAQRIHKLSGRNALPMVKVNCAALPSTLIEAELFGREKGAYTGALTRQVGRFEVADGSTIFLDEVGELPLELQAKLLRILQEGEFERIGSTKTIRVDVRVVAATNRDLAKEAKAGTFREDLFYRLNVFPISMPALRDHPEDIPSLVWSFVKELDKKMGKNTKEISKKSMETLQNYSWPGNVRELRNLIERAMILSEGSCLRVEIPDFGGEENEPAAGSSLQDIERQHIITALKKTGWCVSGAHGAAKLLDINAKTLESKMKKLGIRRPPRAA